MCQFCRTFPKFHNVNTDDYEQKCSLATSNSDKKSDALGNISLYPRVTSNLIIFAMINFQ